MNANRPDADIFVPRLSGPSSGTSSANEQTCKNPQSKGEELTQEFSTKKQAHCTVSIEMQIRKWSSA